MRRTPTTAATPARLAGLFAGLLLSGTATAQTFPFTADATFYGPVAGGNCSFGVIESEASPFLRITAVGTPLYADSSPCGRFIEIDTTDASCAAPPCDLTGDRVVVMISDQLPEPVANLDLSELAFSELADVDEGVLLDVRWRYVHGTHTGTIELHNTVGVNPFFIHFVLQKHNLGITEVQVRDAIDPTWHAAVRDSANQWSVTTGQEFQPPLSIQIKDLSGQTLEATNAVGSLAPGAVFDLGVQSAAPQQVPTGPYASPLAALLIAASSALRGRRPRRLASGQAP